MRLLQLQDAKTFSLVEFLGNNVPPYAILSHTWGPSNEEVTYQDLIRGTGQEKESYRKLTLCGEQAAKDGLSYFWIDTCCIDKSSSADLSEAINSMYFWYKNARVCYAFLSDVHQIADSTIPLKASKWFTRGWTLQELLAPTKLVFYSADWHSLGSKDDLKHQLHSITKIPVEALEGAPLNHFSIAERMSWAANRVTTRTEDIAYSLMGIFDINMPLLYGEREKAFLRLQQHIIQDSSDQSLFAWKDPSLDSNDEIDILAQSPKQFEASNNIKSVGPWRKHDSSTFTHVGLRTELWLIPTDDDERIFRASLACSFGLFYHHSPGIYVKRVSGFKNSWRANPKTQFVRIHGDKLEELTSAEKIKGQHNTVLVRHEPRKLSLIDPIPLDMVIFDIGWQWNSCAGTAEQFIDCHVYPTSSWNPQTNIFTARRGPEALGAILTQHKETSTLTMFGVRLSGEAWVKTVFMSAIKGHWSMVKPLGTEKKESQLVISYTHSSCVVCKAAIWTNRSQSTGRDMFVILVAGELGGTQPLREPTSEEGVKKPRLLKALRVASGNTDLQPRDGGY